MNAALDPAVSRFTELQDTEEEEAELWRGKLQAFRNLYGFLSQVIPYQDSDLEKLYVSCAIWRPSCHGARAGQATSSTTRSSSSTTACRRSAKARSA